MQHFTNKKNPVPEGLLTRNQANQRGLKLRPDAQPVGFKINQNSKKPYYFYSEDSFIPKRQRQISEKQLTALAAGRKRRNGRRGFKKPEFNDQYVFLDTETTGLDSSAQVIEIAVIDHNGLILINERIKPSIEISSEAEQVHGISLDSLDEFDCYADIEPMLKKALNKKKVVIFNSAFDLRLLSQTAKAFGCNDEWINSLDSVCAMRLAAQCYGATNRYGTISLSSAVEIAECDWKGEAHSALGDALTTLELYRHMHLGI